LTEQPIKVQDKIFKILDAIETLERVPQHYLKHLQLASNIWRVFCFFDEGRLVILLNGFQKKTQKTPKLAAMLIIKIELEEAAPIIHIFV